MIAQIEIAIPGYPAINGQVVKFEGPYSLDDVAIQLHELANDLVQALRKAS